MPGCYHALMNSKGTLLGQIKERPLYAFALVGVLSTTIDLLLFKGLLFLGVWTWLATALGFISGLINGYLLNSAFVFQVNRTVIQSLKYSIVSLGGLLITEGIVLGLSGHSHVLSPFEAKLVAVGIVFFWNYVLSRRWAFK